MTQKKLFLSALIPFLLILFMGLSAANSQSKKDNYQKYEITSNNSGKPNVYFLNAVSKANMETFRLKDDDVIVKFKEGVEIKLLSASKLKQNGVLNIELNDYKSTFPKGYILPIFGIGEHGNLLAEYKKKLK